MIVLGWLACAPSVIPLGADEGQVAAPVEGGQVGWPDVVIAPDGVVWATWVDVDPHEHTRLLLAASTDGGRTFPDPVVLEDGPLFLGTVRQPVLAVDTERVAVAVGGGSYIESSVLLFVAPLEDPTRAERLELDAAVRVSGVPSDTVTLVDQPEVDFAPDGEIWITWKRLTVVESVGMVLARESTGFEVVPIDDAVRGQPCECCPVDLRLTEREHLLTYRNNERNDRDIYLLDLDLARAARVSGAPWRVGGCPFDGPALAGHEGTLVTTWVDGTQGDHYVFTARSDDGGATWSEPARWDDALDESMTWPTLAVADDGTWWTSAEAIYLRTRVARSDDDGRSFQEVVVGDVVFTGEIAAGAGRVGLIGVREDGVLVYTEAL